MVMRDVRGQEPWDDTRFSASSESIHMLFPDGTQFSQQIAPSTRLREFLDWQKKGIQLDAAEALREDTP
jgi:hypothetical protein